MSRSGFYDWRRRLPSDRELSDAELTDKIDELYGSLPGRPGVRRVWAELTAHGWRVGRKRVWRLMRAAGLRGRTPVRWRRTTEHGRRPIDAPDLLTQDFHAEHPDTVYCGDITYIATVDGFAYLATVIDLASRMVVGLSGLPSRRPRSSTTQNAALSAAARPARASATAPRSTSTRPRRSKSSPRRGGPRNDRLINITKEIRASLTELSPDVRRTLLTKRSGASPRRARMLRTIICDWVVAPRGSSPSNSPNVNSAASKHVHEARSFRD